MSSIQAPQPSRIFDFTSLPMELRFQIYADAASPVCAEPTDPMEILAFTDGTYDWCFLLERLRLPALAMTDKRICREYLTEYFKLRVFRVNITVDLIAGWTRPDLTPELKAWLRRLQACPWLKYGEDGKEIDPIRFRHISFRVREAENTMDMATINATIDMDYQAKSNLVYHSTLCFDESLNPPSKEGRDEVKAAYQLFRTTLDQFTSVNGIGKPGLSLAQIEVLLRCIDVNPDTRGKYLNEAFFDWDAEPHYEIADWREQGRNMGWIDENMAIRYDNEQEGAAVQDRGWATSKEDEIGYGEIEVGEEDPDIYKEDWTKEMTGWPTDEPQTEPGDDAEKDAKMIMW